MAIKPSRARHCARCVVGDIPIEEGTLWLSIPTPGPITMAHYEATTTPWQHLVAPRSGWIEDLGRHTSARHRERQIEVVAHFVPRLRELARMHRIDHGARILERTASAVRSATDPAGVEQPRGCALCLQLICKHLRVLQRMPHKEGLAIARRESGDGARDAHLGTRHLGCVPVT